MTLQTGTTDLQPGFANPAFDTQATFRNAMEAIAYPGRTFPCDRLGAAPWPASRATAALGLTLLDHDTSAWLDAANADAFRRYLTFHTGVRFVERQDMASFALVTQAATMPRLTAFCLGTDLHPDHGATLIIQSSGFGSGPAATWRGPGINGAITVAIDGLPSWFWDDWALVNGSYPLGVDVLFVTNDQMIGLPRSVQVDTSWPT